MVKHELVHDNVFGNEQDIVFLTSDQVIMIHEEGIKRYSPNEPLTILNKGLLHSAVMTPQQTFDGQYLYKTLTEMATAYMVGLTLNHPFENGNKRVGLAACSTFLRMNGYRLTLSQDEAVDLVHRLASHEFSREDVVRILDHTIERI